MNDQIGTMAGFYMASAAVGAMVVGLEFAIVTGVMTGFNMGGGDPYSIGFFLLLAFFELLVVFAIFFVGLVLVGTPARMALSATGLRRRWQAVTAGAVLASLAGGLLTCLSMDPASAFAASTLVLALPGAAAGWTLHRLAGPGT